MIKGKDQSSLERAGEFRPGLHLFTLLTALATLLLIVAGGLVTSNDAGDSVPDWPLSFGQVIPWPQLVGNVVYEYGHRVIAATVGFLTIILNVMLWKGESRRWVRHLGLVALVAVIAQGTLGGIRVLLLEYRFPVAIIHACLAQIFFSLVVGLTVFTSRPWFEIATFKSKLPERISPSVFYLCAVATGSIFVQLILGAAFRHRGIGILPHILGAVVVTAMLVWTIIAVLKLADRDLNPTVKGYFVRPAKLIGGLLVVQLTLGVGAFWARLVSVDDPQPLFYMVSLTVSHVAGGALTLALTIVLLFRLYQLVTPTDAIIRVPSTPQRAIS